MKLRRLGSSHVMPKRVFVAVCVLLPVLLCLEFTGSVILPQADATIGGRSFMTEIEDLPFHPRVVDVDSNGYIFVLSYDGDIWRSLDAGKAWQKVAKDNYAGNSIQNLQLFVDSHDRVFATLVYAGAKWNLTRSTDHGITWETVLQTRRAWHMDEASNGSLWFHTYTTNWASIHRSDDGGTTWNTFYNFSFSTGTDLRGIKVNDLDPSEVWAFSGQWLKKWNGTNWITYSQETLVISDAWFDSDYVYFGSESIKRNFRYKQGAPPVSKYELDYYWDAGDLTYVHNEHSFDGTRIGDLMLFGIRSQLWGSVDGDRWVKIVDLGDSIASDIASISSRRPIYFVDKKIGKLYRLDITKEDIVHLYNQEYLNYRGYLKNTEDYSLEQRITNGTNYLDLTSVGLSDVSASIKGLSATNQYVNAGFESGNTTGWTIIPATDSGIHSVVTSEKYEGSCSLLIRKNLSDAFDNMGYQDYRTVRKGDVLVWSGCVKGNVSSEDRIELDLRNQTSGNFFIGGVFNLTTSWQRITIFYSVCVPSANIRPEFVAKKGISYEVYVDAFTYRIFEVEYYKLESDSDTESIVHLSSLSPYVNDRTNTKNPTITINGASVSHTGQLTNGSESLATRISGILTGAVKVDASIEGSGQAILCVTGKRTLYEDSIILKGRENGVYYGRYYDVFSPTAATTDLTVVTDLQANITLLSFDGSKLILAINSLSGARIMIEVYVGDKGEPANVSGAVSWSYSPEETIAEINVICTDSQEVAVIWDSIPPTTVNDYENSWHTTDVRISLTAHDSMSNIRETCYRINGGNTRTVQTDGQPLITTESSNNTLEYWSIDDHGNEESPHAILADIKLDKTPPTGSITIDSGIAYTVSALTALTLSAEDATSGLEQMRLSNDNATWTPWESHLSSRVWTLSTGDGVKTVYVQFKDKAGLLSLTYEDTISLDTTKPVSNAGQDRIVSVGDVTTFDASNSTDNLGIVSYEWNYGDGATEAGETTIHTFMNPGEYTVTLNVKDAANNEDITSITVTVLPQEAPEKSQAEVLPMLMIGGALAIIGIAVAASLILKKRK